MVDENEDLSAAIASLADEQLTFTRDGLAEFILEVASKVSRATEAMLELDLEPEEDMACALTEGEFRAVASAVRWIGLSKDQAASDANELGFRAWLNSLSQAAN
jgi:hypothetical protein